MDLDIIVFGEYTLRQLLYTLGALFVLYIFFNVIRKHFFTKKDYLKHSVAYICSHCGWRGQIGKFAKQCPRCSRPVN